MIDSVDVISDLSPEKLSRLAMQHKRGVASRSGRAIARGKERTTFPTTVAQEQLWFFDQLLPGNAAYNMSFPLRCASSLNNVLALEQSTAEIIRRHESLRTTLVAQEGPVQVVHPATGAVLNLVDLSGLQQNDCEKEVPKLATQEASRPFDLVRGPLFRNTTLILNRDEKALLRTIHHTVCDGWSVGVLNRELMQLVTAFGAGQQSNLAELPMQLGDFALDEQERLKSPALKGQLDYWMEKLNGVSTLDLPSDRMRPPVQNFDGAECRIEFSPELSSRLRDLSRTERTTLFVLLMTIYELLLSHYAGQEDIAVGTPIAGRTEAQYQELIGPIFNMLVMRTSLSGDPSFRELLGRVRETATQAYAHPDVPFQKLVESLQRQRDMSRNPLFQTAVVLQNRLLSNEGEPFEPLPYEVQTARYDLEVHFRDEPDGINGFFIYKTSLFDANTIERMAKHLHSLAEKVVADPTLPISTLSGLTESEYFQLTETWNQTQRDYPSDRCIHELIELQASRNADSIAIGFGGGCLTYGEVNRQAECLAHHLRSLGAEPERLVAVFLERSPELVISFLAILKTGAAYLPLDPNYPKERIAYMLGDSKAPVLLTQRRLIPRLPECAARMVVVDGERQQIRCTSADAPANNTMVDNLAYVIYTSGSTGAPKAVQVTHRGLLNLVYWHLKVFGVTERDRSTQLSGTAFDAAGWEIWPYLAAGASLQLIEEETRTSPELLRDWLVANDVTISFLPTPLAETVLSLEWPQPTSLRYMLTGGDTLHSYPPAALNFDLINNYGPTENTVVATYGKVHPEQQELCPPSIGRPIFNTESYLIDQHRRLVPIGVAGELHIGGSSLARGYLNDPILTASKFIPNSFGHKPGSRLYRTGDLARYRADGNIDFLGRTDHQVKIRGFRIELGEIESALAQHPGVREAVVIFTEHSGNSRDLTACCIPLQKPAVSPNELRNFLKSKLPDYMVPAFIFMMEQFPLTENGKIDRKRLSQLTERRAPSQEASVPPSTAMERRIVSILAEVLGTEGMGIHDNFFDAGANSILVARLAKKLRDTLNLQLSVIDLFTYPTVSLLVNHICPQQNKAEDKDFLDPILDRSKLRQRALGW